MKATASLTKYGFRFGPAELTRLHSDQNGMVWIEVKTERQSMIIRVTKTGLIRIEK
jgi:hypothetical protein